MADLDRKSAQFSFRNVFRHHGVGIRGADLSRRSEQYEGRFGRMFRTLPPAEHLQADLSELAKQMTAEREDTPTSENEFDPEENRGISSGYTYWGQFIDHDLTFDPASSLQKTNDPDGLTDFRTPRFDLDSVYGRGPDDQPYLYEDDGIRLRLSDRKLTGNGDDGTFDLQRNAPKAGQKRALIGDPRNDENVIVSQLQGIFIRFHNRVAALTGAKFAEVQRIVRWHYQWAVLHDFLRTIVGDDTLLAVLPHLKNDTSIYDDKPELRFFHWRNEPFMPVEFSVAAYRFGHSMIRPEYRLNSTLPGRFPIFSTTEKDLRGFDEFPDNWAIDWTLFFRFRPDAPVKGKNRVQPAYKIDSSLVSPLGNLPAVIAVNPAVLAERNLLRGLSMSLPSGQTVARHMCIPPIDDAHLRLGKLTNEDFDKNPLLIDRFPNFRDNAPLWYYILAEVQQQFIKGDKKDETPLHLGPVGGRIVAEVFAGLILGDNHSFLAQQPCWRPLPQLCRDGKHFGIADLITFARSK